MINTDVLRGSKDFLGFMEEVNTKRGEAFEAFKTAKGDDLLKFQQRFNAFDEVVELLDQIEAAQKAMAGIEDNE